MKVVARPTHILLIAYFSVISWKKSYMVVESYCMVKYKTYAVHRERMYAISEKTAHISTPFTKSNEYHLGGFTAQYTNSPILYDEVISWNV